MDIKGVKPVASREKQRPLGAKTKMHFGDRTAPISVNGVPSRAAASSSTATQAVQSRPASTALQPVTDNLVADTAQVTQPSANSVDLPKRPQYEATKRKRRISRRSLLLRGAAVCFVLVATIGGLLAWNGYMKLHKVFHGTSIVAALAPKPAKSSTLDGIDDGRVNVLLIGVSGSGGTAADFTDTIALLSIDPVNHKAVLVNLPTDLWVQEPSSYYSSHQELNAVYETGRNNALGPSDRPTDPGVIQAGFSNLDEVVERITGVNINYHLLLNFQAFKQAVDAEGGVNVNSPNRLYDPSLGWRNHVSPVLATAGMQHMDGNQALLYVRSRVETAKSTQVQRELQVLMSLKDEVMSAKTFSDPTKLEGIIESFGDNAYSDLSIKGAEQLYSLMGKIGDTNINSISLNGTKLNLLTTKEFGRRTVAIPSAGVNDYADIQQYVRSYMSNGHIVGENAPVTVVSTTTTGATIAGTMLRSYGLNVTATATSTARVPHFTIVDMSAGRDPLTLQLLQNRYGVKAVTELPAGVNLPPGDAKFVIIEP